MSRGDEPCIPARGVLANLGHLVNDDDFVAFLC